MKGSVRINTTVNQMQAHTAYLDFIYNIDVIYRSSFLALQTTLLAFLLFSLIEKFYQFVSQVVLIIL